MAEQRGAMKPLSGKLGEVLAARVRTAVGELDRTLVVVESQELLAGQKRGIAAALRKAKIELGKLEALIEKGRITRSRLEDEWHLLCLPRVTMALDLSPSLGARDLQPRVGFGSSTSRVRPTRSKAAPCA